MELHKQAQEDILNILRRSIYHGENNSALVIGTRGSGKTYLINKCLMQIRSELSAKNCSSDVIIVSLSGAVQSDDKSALREITRQLRLGNCMRGKVFGSFGDSFEYLIQSLLAGNNQSKPIVFIMDEFDLFTKNKTQLLLYTLLNTIQTAKTPMCVIGATCRIDVLDLLEKRIKSRFSHRQIYTLDDFDFERYLQVGKYFLARGEVNKKSALGKLLEELFADKQILKLLSRQYEYDKSLAHLNRLLFVAATNLDQSSSNDLKPIKDAIVSAFTLFNMDTREALMTCLSILELTLIVVILETTEAYPEEPFNFELIYNAYLKFLVKKNWGQQKHERQIVLKSYEHLISLKFILPASDSTSNTLKSSNINKEHTLMVLALEKTEIEECLKRYPNCPTELVYHSKIN